MAVSSAMSLVASGSFSFTMEVGLDDSVAVLYGRRNYILYFTA